jgi:hypothetical protein
MNRRFRRDLKKRLHSHPSNASGPFRESPRRVPLWQAVALPIFSVLVFLILLEGVPVLLGVQPVTVAEDPLVGFSGNVPLFAPVPGPGGRQLTTTSHNKINFFNAQVFLLERPPGTYRIFSLGGSTTFGHPYDDKASFSGWLRQLLPVTDSRKKWEAINAGGISYASYRVALGGRIPDSQPARILLDFYPSGGPLSLAQVRSTPGGNPVIDGIRAEFYENGHIKYFADVLQGELNGLEMKWDPEGRLISRKGYRKGVSVTGGTGS